MEDEGNFMLQKNMLNFEDIARVSAIIKGGNDVETTRMNKLMEFKITADRGTPEYETQCKILAMLITQNAIEHPMQTRFIVGVKLCNGGEGAKVGESDEMKIVKHLTHLYPAAKPILLEHLVPTVTYEEWSRRYDQIFGVLGAPKCPDHICRHAMRLKQLGVWLQNK